VFTDHTTGVICLFYPSASCKVYHCTISRTSQQAPYWSQKVISRMIRECFLCRGATTPVLSLRSLSGEAMAFTRCSGMGAFATPGQTGRNRDEGMATDNSWVK